MSKTNKEIPPHLRQYRIIEKTNTPEGHLPTKLYFVKYFKPCYKYKRIGNPFKKSGWQKVLDEEQSWVPIYRSTHYGIPAETYFKTENDAKEFIDVTKKNPAGSKVIWEDEGPVTPHPSAAMGYPQCEKCNNAKLGCTCLKGKLLVTQEVREDSTVINIFRSDQPKEGLKIKIAGNNRKILKKLNIPTKPEL